MTKNDGPDQHDDARDLVVDASANILDVWGDLGPSEALIRALVAERNENREMAVRWARVFLRSVGEG